MADGLQKINELLDQIDKEQPNFCNGQCSACKHEDPWEECLRNVLAHTVNEVAEICSATLNDKRVKEFVATGESSPESEKA